MKMRGVIAGLVGLLFATQVLAQAQLGIGEVWGNPDAARAPPKSSTVTAILDRALGSTRGAIIERGAAGWVIVAPGTVGLPWVSAGAGADPLYQILGAPGGGTGQSSYTIGDLLYASTTTALSKLNAVAAGSFLRSTGVGAAPAWSTTIWPNSTTVNRILYSSSANTIGEITTANNGILVTSGGGVPSISTTLPAFTAGGTISGGGNQLNNIIIGTVTPLAGFFTTLSASTSVTSPIYNATGAMTFQSNGGTFAGDITTGQQWYLGGTLAAPQTGPVLTVSKNTTVVSAVGTPGGISSTAQLIGNFVGNDTNAADIVIQSFNNTASGIRYMSAAGTNASKTATNGAGGTIGANFAYTYTGSVYVAMAGFIFTSTEATVTGAASGGRVDLYGTPTGTTGIAIGQSVGAGVMIGTTSDPGAGHLRAIGYLQTGAVAVASLPTCNATSRGARHMVTDANAAFTAGIGAVVAAGGANVVPVACDGTNWRIG